MNLNAGELTAPFIYGCGHFQSVTPVIASATTQPDNQPYVPGTWANKRVDVIFTCFGIGAPTPVSGFAFAAGANQTAASGSGCVDRLNCAASDADSGVKSSTCGPVIDEAYRFGIGKHDVSATVSDQAGNVTTATASFNVHATLPSLKAVTFQLLGTSNPAQSQVLVNILDTAQADPTRFAALTDQYRAYLSAEASG